MQKYLKKLDFNKNLTYKYVNRNWLIHVSTEDHENVKLSIMVYLFAFLIFWN